MNPYDTLGVARDANDAAIKAAYRKAASAAHPDRDGGSEARMQEVNSAYAVLADPTARARYDETGDTEPQADPNASQYAAMAEIFEHVFNAAGENENVVAAARKAISAGLRKASQAKGAAEARIPQLRERLGRMGLREGATVPNIPAALLQKRIEALEREAAAMAAAIESANKLLVLLENYTDSTIEMPPNLSQVVRNDLFQAMLNEGLRGGTASTTRW